MPLLDHFHPPVSQTHSWGSFHARWAVAICDALNEMLPPRRFLAEVQVTVGTRIEADVAEYDKHPEFGQTNGVPAGTAVLQTWTVPPPARSIEAAFPDDIEVQVFDQREGKHLVGAIELISPANKDHHEHRRAFVARVAAYLQRGIGVVVVDIVTDRLANLHEELLTFLEEDGSSDLPGDTPLYAVAYRPVRREETNLYDLWPVSLDMGERLPTLPLALRGAGVVPIDLEATYSEARQKLHL